jgi:hypothetical protein
MVGTDHLDPIILKNLATQCSYRFFRIEQIFCRDRTEAADKFRLDDFQRPIQERSAMRRLVGQRSTIAWRSATQNVANIDILSPEFHSLRDNVGQQLPRPSDERFPLLVFIAARGFAEKYQRRIRIANSENRLRSFRCQFLAPDTLCDFGGEVLELFGFGSVLGQGRGVRGKR